MKPSYYVSSGSMEVETMESLKKQRNLYQGLFHRSGRRIQRALDYIDGYAEGDSIPLEYLQELLRGRKPPLYEVRPLHSLGPEDSGKSLAIERAIDLGTQREEVVIVDCNAGACLTFTLRVMKTGEEITLYGNEEILVETE